ncbi:MAG: AEC family transporter [Clostridia bacterium]|nr:AEC family transporter [Clostridia bacterium]
MNVVSLVIYNVALLFIMMIPGVLLKKLKMVPEGFGKGLSNLVLYIAQPALIFLAYVRDYDAEILKNSAYVFALSIVAHALFAAVSMLFFKKAPDNRRRMLRFATIFSNAAFMGIPLISAVLEEQFPGATLYASIYNITFNLFLWSLGVYICTSKRDVNEDGVDDHKEVASLKKNENDDEKVKDGSGSILKAIYHPVTIAALLGLVFFILPINSYIPPIVTNALSMLKNLVAPLSMVVIGLRLADMNFRGVLRDVHMYLFLALRHIILPLAVVGIIKLLCLCGIEINYVVSMVVVILAATPAASSATMFAEKFDCDASYVSRLVTISTILSILTMPLLIMLV